MWAMSDIVSSGKAVYWGTSEWSAEEIRAAWEIAERHHLHKPVVEQPQYNLFARDRVEKEYARLYEDIGLGLTIWSPLASGLLTGKYLEGVPQGSRAALPGYEWLQKEVTDKGRNAKVQQLKIVADELGATLAQLSLAWCAANPHVSSVITGASRVEQVRENLGALEVIERLSRRRPGEDRPDNGRLRRRPHQAYQARSGGIISRAGPGRKNSRRAVPPARHVRASRSRLAGALAVPPALGDAGEAGPAERDCPKRRGSGAWYRPRWCRLWLGTGRVGAGEGPSR